MEPRPGKTAPRLLQDLLTYDPRYEERAGRNLLTTAPPHYDPSTKRTPAVPQRNCRHSFLTKSEQSQLPKAGEDPTPETIYKIASFCQKCRWHLDLVVDFRDDGNKNEPCKTFSGYLTHHFIFQEDGTNTKDPWGRPVFPQKYKFCCSAPKCPAKLRIRLSSPRFSDQDIIILTDRAHLRRRLENAKLLAGERADNTMARPVDALDFLSTYLQDSLNPKPGKSRIPLMNRKFLKTFGKDCDKILERLGFKCAVEMEADGDDATVWNLPSTPAETHPLEEEMSQRKLVEDARYELNTLILAFPEHERTAVRHPMISAQPSITDIQRALGCLDYDKKPDRQIRSTNHEEDHPYFASLGAVGDFSDALLLFAYTRQVTVDMTNASYYFECLQDIAVGRKSEELQMQVQLLASQGQTNRREVMAAYRYFDIDPSHDVYITDDNIIGVFKSRLQDIGANAAEESRKQLRIIGNTRGSEKIKQVASNAIETYEQALLWLDLDANQSDDFVTTMYAVKRDESASNRESALKAVQIIANERNSQRLRDFLDRGTMDGLGMDTAEAYATLNITDRASPVQLDVLQTQVEILSMEQPEKAERYQEAYDLVCEDQKATHNNSQPNGTFATTKEPKDTWPVGLRNIGNTCYLNSVLQFLFTIKPLRDAVLDPDNFMQDSSPNGLGKKIVGRSKVTSEKLEKAQKFVLQLRNLFEHMIADPEYVYKPETELAALALAERIDPTEAKAIEHGATEAGGLGNIGGVPIAGPMLPPSAMPETKQDQPVASQADSVMGDDDAKSDTSTTAMDLTETIPQPPSRPPPVPPRPQAVDTTIKKIERNAEQQDAAEIMNNIFDLLSCALKGEGTMRDGEQLDLVKELFFSDLTTVRRIQESSTSNSAIQDNHLISPGNRNRSLYAALDDEFSLTEVENDASKEKGVKTYKYEYIEQASPIQIINVRRLVFEDGKSRKDESQIGLDPTLYLDRYLKETASLSEDQLLALRERQWHLQQQLNAIEARKKKLRETELKLSLPDAVSETATFLENLSKESQQQLIDVDEDPIPNPSGLPEAMREQARDLQKEAEAFDQQMKELDEKINAVFDHCRDHPYRLHSVFIHRGSATGGHYYIYIYDAQNEKWRSYNDEVVTQVEEKDVLNLAAHATSTGIVYVRQESVQELTEAVHRKLDPPVNEVEMKDVEEYQDVQVINGIEEVYDSQGVLLKSGRNDSGVGLLRITNPDSPDPPPPCSR